MSEIRHTRLTYKANPLSAADGSEVDALADANGRLVTTSPSEVATNTAGTPQHVTAIGAYNNTNDDIE